MAKRGNFKTSVGGQAVMEGVMMQGPKKWCLAVRNPEKEIVVEVHDVKKRPWAKLVFIRGIFNFINSMIMGYKTLSRSAEIAMTEEESEEEASKFDKWLEEKLGEKAMNVVMAFSMVFAVILALGLFMFLPSAAVKGLDMLVPLGGFKTLAEGLIKIIIFILYIGLVGRMEDMRRVFSYHGAEHKTISCYESGDELTVENVMKHTRFHPRCGTSFIFIVLIISILVNSIIPWTGNVLLRVGFKLLLLPAVMGISYEIIRLAGKYDNVFTKIVSAPGLWLQRLTTKEPDESMVEVALEAVKPVLPKEAEEAKW